MDLSENIFKLNKDKNRRVSKRIPYSEESSFFVIGSIDISNCSTDECLIAKIKEITNESIILLTDNRLRPGTLFRFKDLNDQIQTAVVIWSLSYQTHHELEALLI